MKKRLSYIDIAKGLGILVVIFSHSGGENGLMAYIGGFFIPLFFILSGYTLSIPSNQSFKTFLSKKSKRLLLPYLLFSIILLFLYRTFLLTDFIGVVYSRYCFYLFNTEDNIFFMRGGNAPLWFLTSMFTAYFFVWFLLKTDKYRLYVACVYILITYGLSFLPILMPWSLDTAFLMAVFIWIGTCLKNIDMNHWSRWFYFIMVIIYAALCTLNGEPNLSVRVYARSILLILITGTIGTILVIAVSKKLEHTFVKKMLIVLGQHSMVVFCFQMLLLRIQNDILFKIMQIPLNIYTLYLTSILKTIIAAMLGVYISKVLNRILPKIFY